MKIRTLIVDDEPLARRHLSCLLGDEPDFEVSGECADGAAALLAIAETEPDLIFLDVQMPAMGGFEVLDSLATGRRPQVVFVTAFDQFAVRAFEARAMDYLLKPFRRERFRASLERVRSGFGTRRHAEPAAVVPDRMVAKSGDRLIFVSLAELEFVRASANYVKLHVGEKCYEVRETITSVEARLPRERFVRIHRSFIVNLAAVVEMYPVGGGEYMIALRCGRHLPVGATHPPAIREALLNASLLRLGGAGAI